MPPIPLPPPTARLQTLQTLRSAILTNKSTTNAAPTPTIVSRRQQLLTHYPPDIDVTKLAAQDDRLAGLGLVDVWKQMKIAREKEMEKRGKPPRVSVATGLRKKTEADTGKKKKGKK